MPATDAITDVPGIAVGHRTSSHKGWRTGTTVVVAPLGAVGGVDVRGGGPGTHETDLLRPENLVHHVHAVCLTGGSAFGLAAAGGVMTALESHGIGFPVGIDGDQVVPIVPAAVIYDLGRGGTFAHRPDASFGRDATLAALRAARRRTGRRAPQQGTVGAGTGAMSGGLQGGVGSASVSLPPSDDFPDGVVVGAIAVVNSAGSVIDARTGLPWEVAGHGLVRPSRADRDALDAHRISLRPPLNTTIGIVATSAALGKAECHKLASVTHDGLARAIRPAHSMFDGDTVFALSTGTAVSVSTSPNPIDGASARERAVALSAVFEAGATAFSIACTRAVLAATSHRGGPPAYRDLCPTAFRALDRASPR
jgi:L-aminopeptidase/D-esterase-like protein